MKAVIMAGGEGSRLRPLTCAVPKPMVMLCGKPAIVYILDLLDSHGCTEAVITLGYLGEVIERHFETGRYKGIKLTFSSEDVPLGTAGSVKLAAQSFREDFVVISADAMCDFDLNAILNKHKQSKAVATIVTKSVDDPREYGLVCSENGTVTGFSEKPSYTACVSDAANTGVYVLSPSVLELIPEGKSDFARDIFPKILENGGKINACHEQSYWCDIGTFEMYRRCQADMLTGKVKCEIVGRRRDSEIINLSENDNSAFLRSPCYIGRNVSIGTGSVIEAGSVISDNVTIGRGVRIHGSVILGGTVIGDGSTVNGSVIGENVAIKNHACVFEDSVIGDNVSLGAHSIINMGVRIWPNRSVGDNQRVSADVKYGTKVRYTLSDDGLSGETNVDITAEFLLKTGCAAAELNRSDVAVAYSGESGRTMKNALISGITSCGTNVFDLGECSLPELIYASRLLDCGCVIHIFSNSMTNVSVLNRGGLPLTRAQERRFESALNNSDYNKAEWNKIGKVTDVSASRYFYLCMLSRLARLKSSYHIIVSGSNSEYINAIKPVFDKISSSMGENLVITVSPDCSKARFYTEKTGVISAEKLTMIAASGIMKSGEDVALPNEFAGAADIIAENLGRKILRYYASSNDNSDLAAREKAACEPFLFDGAVLALTVLDTLTRECCTLFRAVEALPQFATETRYVLINCPPQKLLRKILPDSSAFGEGIVMREDNRRVLVRSGKDGRGLFLFSESQSSETAKELCDSVETLINKLGNEKEN